MILVLLCPILKFMKVLFSNSFSVSAIYCANIEVTSSSLTYNASNLKQYGDVMTIQCYVGWETPGGVDSFTITCSSTGNWAGLDSCQSESFFHVYSLEGFSIVLVCLLTSVNRHKKDHH